MPLMLCVVTGGLFGTWKIRYFIITATAHLLYFEDKTTVAHVISRPSCCAVVCLVHYYCCDV
jgi:hypothetical protein